DEILGSGTVDADPWLILSLSAAPDVVPLGGSSILTARLTEDSNGGDTTALGFVPDDIEILFDGAGLGPVNPPADGTVDGVATSTLSAQNTGLADVAAALDNQVVTTPVRVGAGAVDIPAASPLG
ncbi:MAG: hypothetical protein KDD47_24635, partial [Acidobacteria bacterium]|nr:hypothetical protein [Acidobacteriota bacterium]